jgi:6-phosphofructokinase 1
MAGKNAFYAQSGGVTAVISASACGVLQTARQHSDEIGKVYCSRGRPKGETRGQYRCSPPVPWNGFEN